MATVEYETIHRIVNNYKTENFDKINVYGVITFINAPRLTISNNFCTSITLVDDSCTFDEKLKTIVFSGADDIHPIHRACEVGDIVRFHRFKVQDYKSQAQGCSNSSFTSWIRFKKDADDFEFEGNKHSTITAQDEERVRRLRDWLRSRPALAGLIEAKLADPPASVMDVDAARADASPSPSKRTRLSLETAAQARDTSVFNRLLFLQPRLATFAQLKQDGYFDIVCQLCAKCSSKGFKFFIVWDGTATNLAVHQEGDFVFEHESDEADAQKIYYNRSINDKAYQVFLFDEYAELAVSFQPGDFILLKNANSKNPTNSIADTVIKMPTGGKNYKREMVRLAGVDGKISMPRDCPEAVSAVVNRIREIKAAAEASNLSFINEQDFFGIFRSLSFNDSVLNDNTNKRPSPAKAASNTEKPNAQREPISIDSLLRDQAARYQSDDEQEENVAASASPNRQRKLTRTPNSKVASPESRPRSPKKSQSAISISTSAPQANKSTLKPSSSESVDLVSASKETRNDEFYKSLQQRFQLKEFRIPIQRVDVVKTESMESSSQDFYSLHNESQASTSAAAALANGDHSQIPQTETHVKLSPAEISSDINDVAKLVNMTYVVPFLTEANFLLNKPTIPPIQQPTGQQLFFENLRFLSKAAQQSSFIKCQVVAKLFNFAISSCPQIATVFVNCKKCSYVNFTPFHLAGIHQTPLLTSVLNDLSKREDETAMETDEADDLEQAAAFVVTDLTNGQTREPVRITVPADNVDKFREDLKCAQNFSLRWLKNAMPFDIQIRATQTVATQSQATDSIPIMFYECPRCAFRARYLERPTTAANSEQHFDEENYTPVTLEYIYRFWFVLRDPHDQLTTCLLEGDAAHKFLNVPAAKFYTNAKIQEQSKSRGAKNASHQVYQQINKCFNKKYLFSIEAYNVKSAQAGTPSAATATVSAPAKKKELEVVYKITDMQELV